MSDLRDLLKVEPGTLRLADADFLWRIRRALPTPGYVGIFNRSQYEDVLIVRVHNLVSEKVWSRRYDEINAFEAEQAADGLTMVKAVGATGSAA